MFYELSNRSFGKLTHEEFLSLCMDHRDNRLEGLSDGNIVSNLPASSESGYFNACLNAELVIWNRKNRVGFVFDSSTGFTLPNSAVRSPDVSLVLKERWEALSYSEKKSFAHICPDFVVEIISSSDSRQQFQNKMTEWISQGASLGWLIDFDNQKVWIYSADGGITEHPFAQPLIGNGPVDGFEVSLPEIMAG